MGIQQTKQLQCIFIMAAFLVGSLTSLAQTTLVTANKMNVLFIGVENPITVSPLDDKRSEMTVTLTGAEGTVIRTGDGQFNVRVSSVTDNCLLNVFVNGKKAGVFSFHVKTLPYTGAAVGGYPSGTKIPKNVFKSLPGVGVYVRDAALELKYNVVSYTIKLLDDAGNIVQIHCEGALFSPAAKQAIHDYAKSGDIITIEKIWARSEEGREVKLPALLYYIE